MKNTALSVAGLIFLLMTIAHFLRYYQAIPVMIGDFSVPMDWSIYGGGLGILLALWMFISTSKK